LQLLRTKEGNVVLSCNHVVQKDMQNLCEKDVNRRDTSVICRSQDDALEAGVHIADGSRRKNLLKISNGCSASDSEACWAITERNRYSECITSHTKENLCRRDILQTSPHKIHLAHQNHRRSCLKKKKNHRRSRCNGERERERERERRITEDLKNAHFYWV
jgi:hypothetical protein